MGINSDEFINIHEASYILNKSDFLVKLFGFAMLGWPEGL